MRGPGICAILMAGKQNGTLGTVPNVPPEGREPEMASVPIVHGKKVNRFLCLFFLALALIFLALTGMLILMGRPDFCSTALTLAAILGGFSLFYGIGWFIWHRREGKAEAALRRAEAGRRTPGDAGGVSSREFLLPRERLTGSAFLRFMNILRWTAFAGGGVFLLILGIQLAYGSLRDSRQIVYTLLFCILIVLPGIAVQWSIYRKYERTVPQRIQLHPGELVIDNRSFAPGDIRGIRISPDRLYNPNSPAVFRNLLIQTNRTEELYRIDYRAAPGSGEQPFWEEYERFSEALQAWGEENGVPVVIEYME